MRVKLDENLGRRTIDVFVTAGHDVATVVDQGLVGRMHRLDESRRPRKAESETRLPRLAYDERSGADLRMDRHRPGVEADDETRRHEHRG